MNKKRRIIERMFFGSWWVFLALFIVFLGYAEAMRKKGIEISDIERRYTALNNEKEAILEDREDLLLRLRSQNDSEWIERVLMKELGVVPEGKMKIHFAHE